MDGGGLGLIMGTGLRQQHVARRLRSQGHHTIAFGIPETSLSLLRDANLRSEHPDPIEPLCGCADSGVAVRKTGLTIGSSLLWVWQVLPPRSSRRVGIEHLVCLTGHGLPRDGESI